MKAVPSKSDLGHKHGEMLLGVSGQTLAGFCQGERFYTMDKQGRVFDQYGKRVYQEGEVQMVEESSDEEQQEPEEEEKDLGVKELPEDESDDDDTPLKDIAERRQRMAK